MYRTSVEIPNSNLSLQRYSVTPGRKSDIVATDDKPCEGLGAVGCLIARQKRQLAEEADTL